MNLGYWMIFLLIPLVGAILVMIVIAPEDIPQPKIQPEIATEKSTEIESELSTSSKVPAPGFENVPEMIIQEESISMEEELGKTEPEAMVKEREPFAADKVEVNIPTGSSIPGCEETMECFMML